MKFIGILFITFFIVWLIGKILSRFWPSIVMWLLKRQIRRQMDQAFGQAQSGPQREYDPFGYYRAQQAQADAYQRRRRKGKKIDPNVGEYIEFEEIRTATTYTAEPPTPSKPEPQIEDADWEELQ